jgi:4-hydroxy-2-oxoheptanedioate aldolase
LPNYLRDANEQVCLLVQVESKSALDELAAICKIDGVDGIFIGPADLSASMGYLGQPDHPVVTAAIESAILTIVASGKAAGILSTDEERARRYLSLGASFVAVGVDTSLLIAAAKALAGKFKAAAVEAPTPPTGFPY